MVYYLSIMKLTLTLSEEQMSLNVLYFKRMHRRNADLSNSKSPYRQIYI
jgi:hypothetical protein